jgi:hypothetical protein
LVRRASNDLYFFRDDSFLTKSFYNENDPDAIHFNDYDNYEYYAIDMVKKDMEELKSMSSSKTHTNEAATAKESQQKVMNSILYDSQSDLSTNLSKLDYFPNKPFSAHNHDELLPGGNDTSNLNYSSLLIRNQYSIQHSLSDDTANRYNQNSLF